MLDGNELVSSMVKLKDVHNIKDVNQLTNAVFPGAHCPLFGAALAIRAIEDSIILVIGTDECCYYTKTMMLNFDESKGLAERCLSVVLDQHDITFGSKEKLEAAFEEIFEEYAPKLIFLVTTCVIEVIGDDVDSVVEAMNDKYDAHIISVHTEHFKSDSHIPGLERTLTACFDIMGAQGKKECVNFLGHRHGRLSETELGGFLKKSGIEVSLCLPYGCTVEEIEAAPSAKVNIVANAIALPLAEKMKNKFGIPYVFFDKFVSPDHIYQAYEALYGYLEIHMPEEIQRKYAEAKEQEAASAHALKGIKYIYGNTPFNCFEMNAFMVSLGMIPELIQTSEIDAKHKEDIEIILMHTNPYITKTANIAPLQYVYDVLKPDLYLGHEFAMRLRKKGIAVVRSDRAGSMLGFEVTDFVLHELIRASIEAKEIQKEMVER